MEKGGSGLRYSFGIKNGKVLYEVGVDAETGKVPRKLERRAESGLAVKAMLGCKSSLELRHLRRCGFVVAECINRSTSP